ncbi:MAG: DNA-processing protein DprA [Candidatus Uhrbacteria bacterium]|nr:DNA-processing protein DprA [Candidatus Uhrbacteria bacterium]
MSSDLKYWLALNVYPKFGPKSLARLFNYFDSMEEAFSAPLSEIKQAGIPEKIAQGFTEMRENINPNATLAELEQHGFNAITLADPNYPAHLKQIYDPPAVINIWGTLPSSEIAHLAVVGSRQATPYGLRVTRGLIEEVAEAGVVIVSGLAYGIDEVAHLATVNVRGLTVAVLASGLLSINGRQKAIAQKIVQTGGAVISEFSLNAPGQKQNFPFRNRVISGMCQGTLVVEAAEKSGSLITARTAMEQNREVFAIPGPITSPTSYGTNNLIKFGATPVTCAEDILDGLNIESRPNAKPKPKPASTEEALIIETLSKQPVHIDNITRITKLPPNKVSSTLSLMEIKGRARHVGGRYYILV